ncbi:hypothetical protein J2T34_003398 [Kerstersia gyiorum]|nr:hypothetical protein [Kerstersia gyiorum]MCP1672889.1 hypothetical protein [Kerstersia gyiorum]MCP1710802.1 hypothetical protein [Kerstersia gyiorum]
MVVGIADVHASELSELLIRPDANCEDVQRAVAVVDEYLAPHGSPEAVAAGKRARPVE